MDIENRLVVVWGRQGAGVGNTSEQSQKVQISSYKMSKSWDVRYSIVTIVNNPVLNILK